jgi:hypothetical protein
MNRLFIRASIWLFAVFLALRADDWRWLALFAAYLLAAQYVDQWVIKRKNKWQSVFLTLLAVVMLVVAVRFA